MQPASANNFETLVNVPSVRLDKSMFVGSSYLSDSSDIFDSGFLVEAEIPVQPEANVVSIETVGKFMLVQKMLLERTSDARLRIKNHRPG